MSNNPLQYDAFENELRLFSRKGVSDAICASILKLAREQSALFATQPTTPDQRSNAMILALPQTQTQSRRMNYPLAAMLALTTLAAGLILSAVFFPNFARDIRFGLFGPDQNNDHGAANNWKPAVESKELKIKPAGERVAVESAILDIERQDKGALTLTVGEWGKDKAEGADYAGCIVSVGDKTNILKIDDKGNYSNADKDALKKGLRVRVTYSGAATRSIPPQLEAIDVILLPENGAEEGTPKELQALLDGVDKKENISGDGVVGEISKDAKGNFSSFGLMQGDRLEAYITLQEKAAVWVPVKSGFEKKGPEALKEGQKIRIIYPNAPLPAIFPARISVLAVILEAADDIKPAKGNIGVRSTIAKLSKNEKGMATGITVGAKGAVKDKDVDYEVAIVHIKEDSRVLHKTGDNSYALISAKDLEESQMVEVIYDGMAMESYPVQINAIDIIVLKGFKGGKSPDENANRKKFESKEAVEINALEGSEASHEIVFKGDEKYGKIRAFIYPTTKIYLEDAKAESGNKEISAKDLKKGMSFTIYYEKSSIAKSMPPQLNIEAVEIYVKP